MGIRHRNKVGMNHKMQEYLIIELGHDVWLTLDQLTMRKECVVSKEALNSRLFKMKTGEMMFNTVWEATTLRDPIPLSKRRNDKFDEFVYWMNLMPIGSLHKQHRIMGSRNIENIPPRIIEG